MTRLDDLAAAAEKVSAADWYDYSYQAGYAPTAAENYAQWATPERILRLVAVARAAQHQRDTRPGAQPQLVAALAALEEVR